MTDSLKVAIIGAGYMASEHLKAFAALPNVNIVGVYSRSRSRAERLVKGRPETKVYDSISELYLSTKAQIVVVTVSVLAMHEVARECFLYPWTILLEKPAGHTLALASEIIEDSRRSKSRVFVALNRRSYSSTRVLCERLEKTSGKRFIKVQDQEDILAAALQPNMPTEVIANWMFGNAIHIIDYFYILGRGEISKVTPIERWNAAAPGIVVGHIEYESGDSGLYEAVWNAPAPWAVTVVTQHERYEMRPLEKLSLQRYGERKMESVPLDQIDETFKPGLYFQAQEITRAIDGGHCCLATLDDSFKTMNLIAMLYE